MGKHIPVLLKETIDGLNVKKDGIYLDLTVGRGGHSSEILKKLDTGYLIGVDQDIEAINESQKNLSEVGSNFELVHQNFISFINILKEKGIEYVDGILMDLGVSSPQFDEGDRGFSYKEEARLDMRMDQSNPKDAYQVVNSYSLEDLARVFREYGEDKLSYQIAKNIIKARAIKPIETTTELVDVIKKSKPAKELSKAGHPAKQIFQSLRIEVNDELNVLKVAIEDALKVLRPHGGRLAIITFHSLEDRIVKNAFKDASVVIGDRIDGPMVTKEKDYVLVNRKPIVASDKELEINHRAFSAKLRIIERK